MKTKVNEILTETIIEGVTNLKKDDFWKVMRTLKEYEFQKNSERSKKGWKTKKKMTKMKELKEFLNGYEEINENNELINDMGEGEIILENVWDCYDCGLGYNELIYECVELRKQINNIKQLVKEI